MAQTLETLSRQMASMQGIRNIVHTMKTLSVINSAPYEHAAKSIEAYHQTVLEGLHAFLTKCGPLNVASSAIATRVMVVFGSDHGLCGNYNEILAADVAAHLHSHSEDAMTILCVGAQMAEALADQGIAAIDTFFPPASVDGIERLANLLTRHLDDIRHKVHPSEIAVSLAYFARDAFHSQKPKITALLPLDPFQLRSLEDQPWKSRSLPFFSMSPDDLLMALIRSHLFTNIFRAAAEALTTENAARLALMQQAERAVDDRLEQLTSDTHAVRQNEITTELLDVIIGFEALKKRKT